MNQKIYNKFKSPGIIKVSKVCRLEWLGHVVGMDSEEVSGRQTRRREIKRPRLGLMDDAKLDLRKVTVKNGETELLTEQNGHLS